jgi:8-oxo-dGTP pyrophosphatase MutT (NUDIX family)
MADETLVPGGLPRRPTSRLLILDEVERVLLLRFQFRTRAGVEKVFWATPGGGLERDESFLDGAERELLEETGIRAPVGPQVARNEVIYELPAGETVLADERFFLVRVQKTVVLPDGRSALERRVIQEHRWWTLDAVESTRERIYPRDLASMLRRLRLSVQR